MKTFAYFCFIFLFAASCSTGSLTRDIRSNPPASEFVRFCSDVLSTDWSYDSSRLVKKGLYGELNYKSVKRIDGQPFYPISFERSQIVRFLKNESLTEKLALFEKAKSAWGFFYFRQNGTFFPDGVIEQWEFDSNDQAKEAMDSVRKSGDMIFFNTQPYFCVVKNNLYVFHTRAMAFSYDQKAVFEEFVKRNKAEI